MDSPVARRSFSLPVKRLPSSPDSSIEILFNIPSEVRIICFTATSNSTSRPASSCKGSRDGELSGMSWTSRFESIIAIGPLHIYRAPGSVAFLSCAKALRPILPKSKCWAVDEDANTFILQGNPPQYWRIEVPTPDDGGPHWGQKLKVVFEKILMFEKTPCPFSRSFTVELPSPPQTPIKKRPWKPVERPKLAVMQADNELIEASSGQVEDTRVREQMSVVEEDPAEGAKFEFSPDASPTSSPGSQESENDTITMSRTLENLGSHISTPEKEVIEYQNISACRQPSPELDAEIRELEVLKKCHRSMTAPPLLTLVTSPPSKYDRQRRPDTADSDISSSVASFHTMQSWHSPLSDLPFDNDEATPSPTDTFPYPHDNIVLSSRLQHSRETSELTLTPNSEPPRTPPLLTHDEKSDEENDEITTPPSPRSKIRHRATTSSNSRRRALSPLPAAVNLFSPPRRSRRLRTARHLPTAIIQKTCEILLSPPSHVLHLILSIAAKIAAGEWKGMLCGGGEEVHWDLTDEYVNEDDFGISLPGLEGRSRARREAGGSWEVD